MVLREYYALTRPESGMFPNTHRYIRSEQNRRTQDTARPCAIAQRSSFIIGLYHSVIRKNVSDPTFTTSYIFIPGNPPPRARLQRMSFGYQALAPAMHDFIHCRPSFIPLAVQLFTGLRRIPVSEQHCIGNLKWRVLVRLQATWITETVVSQARHNVSWIW